MPSRPNDNSKIPPNQSPILTRKNTPPDPFLRLIEEWLEYCRGAGLSPKTIKDYREKVTKFHWWWEMHTGYAQEAGQHPRCVTTQYARQFAVYLREPVQERWGITSNLNNKQRLELAPASIEAYGRTIKTFFGWLEAEGYIAQTPFNKSVKFRTRHKEDKVLKVVELSDLTKIFRALNDPERIKTYDGIRNLAIIAVLLDSGVRRGELLSMKLKGLDLKNDRCEVWGKTGHRWAVFSHLCMGHLSRYMQQYRRLQDLDPDSNLWLCEDGTPLSYDGFSSLIRRLEERSGVDFHAHMLRHTFGTLLARQGATQFEIKDLLGHENISTTEIYVHGDVDRMNEVQRVMSPLKLLAETQPKLMKKRGKGRPRKTR